MFSALSPRLRLYVRIALATSWVLAGASGAVAIFGEPSHVIDDWGFPLRLIWGGVVGVCGLIAALGVVLNRYRLEWGAAWFSAAAAVPYVMSIWVLSIYEPDRMSGAFFMTSLVAMMITRALLCAAHAEKLRTANTETIPYVSGG